MSLRHARPLAAVIALVAAAALAAPAVPRAAAPPPGLDAHIARVMQAFEVPGVAVTIVKDGETVLAKGYGVRRLGAPAAVDAATPFGIASNTKVFTALALALLVEEGTIEWNEPVVRYLPAFAMSDPWVTREITVRDLLVHSSGLPLGAGDLLWWPSAAYDRSEIVRRIRHLEPTTSFRSAYAYDNVLYLAAGELIEAVSAQSWEDFVAARILAPAGMRATSPRASAATPPAAATPHARVEGRVRPVAPFLDDAANPAAGITSNATDMARWLTVLLAKGALPGGGRLFSERTFRALTAIVTSIPASEPPAELAALRSEFRGYGLGLGIAERAGRKLVGHYGGLPGSVSRVLLVPAEGLGIAVLTNQESSEALDAITWQIVDHYLRLAPTDWVTALATVRERRERETAEAVAKAAAARDAASRPSRPLTAYAGVYRDPWYGDVEIALEESRLVMRFTRTPLLVGDLEHWQQDTFVARWRDRELRADAFVTFSLNPDGTVERAKMTAVSPETDFSFDFHHLLLRPLPAAQR